MNKPTPEQLEALARERAAVYRFLSKHPTFKQCKENGDQIGAYLQRHELPFTLENIEQAYETMQPVLLFNEKAPTHARAADKTDEPDEPVLPYPWPSPLTVKIIRDMSREDYRKFMKDPRFVEQVQALNITTRT